MERGVAFELLRVSDLDQGWVEEILALLRLSFARWPPFDPGVPLADHLRWKMTSPSAELAAVVGRAGGDGGGSLVASLTIVTQRVLVLGREVPRLRFIDQAVHPDCRGRGLSAEMNRFVQDTVRQERLRLTDRGSHPAMVRLRAHQGSLPFGNPVRPLLWPLRPMSLARDALTSSGRQRTVGLAMPLLGAVARGRRRRPRPAARALRVRLQEHFDSRSDLLWEAVSSAFDVAVVRDASHLQWRYADVRGGPSTILVAEEDGELLGWAALKTHGTRAHLADLLVSPGRDDVVEALAREVIARLGRAGASEVSCWLPARHPYRRPLLRCGFLSWGRLVPLAYRWEGDGAVDDGLLGRPDAKLHFTLGDSDFV